LASEVGKNAPHSFRIGVDHLGFGKHVLFKLIKPLTSLTCVVSGQLVKNGNKGATQNNGDNTSHCAREGIRSGATTPT
jgi:hypothetical protein